ncbi:MAG: hypothetical protein ACRCST_15645 [Turicibacter sp.]
MSQFFIKADGRSIIRLKRNYLFVGISLLIINFYFFKWYLQLAIDTNNQGYFILISTFVNLPLLIISIVLMCVPLMYNKYFNNLEYSFGDLEFVVKREENFKIIKSSEINLFEINEIKKGTYKIKIWFSEHSLCYQLEGIQYADIRKIKSWCDNHSILIHE